MFFWNKKKSSKNSERKIPYMKEITKIHDYHKTIENLSQDELKTLTFNLRENEEIKPDDKKVQAYAIAFELIKRTLYVTPYDVQLSGAIALREGNIAQMRTGEGKTITAIFPAFWGFIDKQQTFVITVNEYLAERDHAEAQTVFSYLDIEIGLVLKDMEVTEKKEAYSKPVTYVTNTEFAFDYLRDNIATDPEMIMQGDFDFVIIDEADLVLIDEAKNPVIISGEAVDNVQYLEGAKAFVETLVEDEDFIMDEDYHIPVLTEEAFDKGKAFFGFEIIEKNALYNAINQAMLAKHKFKKDVDYIVRDGEVMIVDHYTGRVLPGRRFQNGLHQALEMKENVEINPENQTIASTTYQSLFRQFKVRSGMTGTAIESKDEFQNIYGMEVKVIPTNKPVQRIDHPDMMYETKKDKYNAILAKIQEKYVKGQPVLIGTTSVQESEIISNLLRKNAIPFNLLNAKNDKEESEIIKNAGMKDMVTISTNMAGRGTDIKISEEVEKLGGLCVIGTSRNESKRIDRQLQGRSGRQGQVGESIFFTSLEDELLVMNPTNRLEKFKKKNKFYPVDDEKASLIVDEIQEAIDSKHASIRKLQFQMDDILHIQREYVYKMRREILLNGLNPEKVEKRAKAVADAVLEPYISLSDNVSEWDWKALKTEVKTSLGIQLMEKTQEELYDTRSQEIHDFIVHELMTGIQSVTEQMGESDTFYKEIGKHIAIGVIDRYWMVFLGEIDMYKQGFGFSAMGEQDPVRKFSLDMDSIFRDLEKQALFEVYRRFNEIVVQPQQHPTISIVMHHDVDQQETKEEENEEVPTLTFEINDEEKKHLSSLSITNVDSEEENKIKNNVFISDVKDDKKKAI